MIGTHGLSMNVLGTLIGVFKKAAGIHPQYGRMDQEAPELEHTEMQNIGWNTGVARGK